jgi:capsule polysaccharide export protein KpsE/RkpR
MVCEELKAQYEQLQSRSERERSVSESIQKEIYSLQHALAEQIERSNNGSSSTEVIARDLKHQLSEKEWRLEKLHQDVKSMQKARDDALSAKHELVASHQAELAVCPNVCLLHHLDPNNCVCI